MLNTKSPRNRNGDSVIPSRLKAARLRANLTQEKLGVFSGIEEATARYRVSQYESGVHRPTFEMMCAFAQVLKIPECYFYTVDDEFADKIIEIYEQWLKS